MRLKNWVSVSLLILTAVLMLSLFMTDNIILNTLSLSGMAINILILTKYSKICDYERREK